MATGKTAVTAALRLLGHGNGYGCVDENREARYFGLAPSYLNVLCAEIAAAEGAQGGDVAGLDSELPISDDSARRVLPFGLAMYFAVIDRESDLYNHFSSVYYGTLLPSVRAPEADLTDAYGVLQDESFLE